MGRGCEFRPLQPASVLVAASLSLYCGSSQVTPRQISHSSTGAYEAALTATDAGFIASWYDIRDGNGEIYVRSIDDDGQPSGSETRLTRSPAESYEPSIAAFPGGRVAVGWYDKAADGTLTARIGLWTATGMNIWTNTLPGAGRNPVLAVDRGLIVAAWIRPASGSDGEDVWAARWNEVGELIGEPLRLGAAHRTTWNVNLDVDDEGVAWVVWDAVWQTRASELFLARVAREALPPEGGSLPPKGGSHVSVTRLTTDDGQESKYPDVALRSGDAALTWFDARDGNTEVYLFAGDAGELTSEIGGRARQVTNTRGESIGAYLAWNGTRIGLAWCDDTVGQHEIYFQPFDRRGKALAEARRVTDNSMSSLIPAIVPWREGFALAWSEFVPATPGGHGGRSDIAFAVVPSK
jgi:hypothetical protein